MWWDIPVNEVDFEATRSPAITNKFVNWPLIQNGDALFGSLADPTIIRKPWK